MLRILLVGLVWTLGSVACGFADDNWPQFLGPRGNGETDARDLPITWSETENIRWKTPIHGRAWSSPVIWGSQVWMTTATEDGKELSVVCLNKETGKVLHDFKLFDNPEPQEKHLFNSYASPTPVIEDGRVYVTFGSAGTACIESSIGAILWTRQDFKCNHFRGAGSSPILWKNLFILNFDGFDLQYMVALDKSNGETVWKVDRKVDYGTENGDYKKAFCTPRVFLVDGQPQLVSPTSKAAIAYNPENGEEIWRIRYSSFSAAIPPMYALGLVYINTGFGKADVYAVRPQGSGDLTETHVAWKQSKNMPSKPAAVLHDNHLYAIHDSGTAGCLNALTGEVLWQHRVGGKFSSSALLGENRIYLPNEDGETVVMEPNVKEYRELARNKLDDGCLASPAVSGRAIFLRTRTALYRIEKP